MEGRVQVGWRRRYRQGWAVVCDTLRPWHYAPQHAAPPHPPPLPLPAPPSPPLLPSPPFPYPALAHQRNTAQPCKACRPSADAHPVLMPSCCAVTLTGAGPAAAAPASSAIAAAWPGRPVSSRKPLRRRTEEASGRPTTCFAFAGRPLLSLPFRELCDCHWAGPRGAPGTCRCVCGSRYPTAGRRRAAALCDGHPLQTG